MDDDDEDLSFRERVEKIRERREQSTQSQNAGSQQQTQNVSISMNQGTGSGTGFEHETRTASHVSIELPERTLKFSNVAVQRTRLAGQLQYGVSGPPDKVTPNAQSGSFSGQQFEHKPLKARHVLIEFADETLEFDDMQVLKTVMAGQYLYGVPGEPDRRRSTATDDLGNGGKHKTPSASVEESKTHIVEESPQSSDDSSETVVWTGDDVKRSTGDSTETQTVQYCPGCSADLSSVTSPSFCHECGRDLSDLG